MGRSWVMSISTILSLSVVVLGYVIFWGGLKDTFRPIHLAFFLCHYAGCWWMDFLLRDPLSLKSFDCKSECCFIFIRKKFVGWCK